MRKTIIILIILLSKFVYSQERTIHVKTYENGDTSFWYNWSMNLCDEIGIKKIQSFSTNSYLRLWTNRQTVDIWSDNKGEFHGKITTWTEEYTPAGEDPTNRIFIQSDILNSNQVSNIIQLIDSSNIKLIPDQDLIKNWGYGFDGITYIIELANKTEYYFKSYWTPVAQDTLKEAVIVQNFVDRILELSNANLIWEGFVDIIPYEYYINGGPFISFKRLTKKEIRKFKKERNNYRRQSLKIEQAEN